MYALLQGGLWIGLEPGHAGQDRLVQAVSGCSCPHAAVFPGVQAEQGELISTASYTFSGFLLPPACHRFTFWSLRKQGYLCPGLSFEFGHSRRLLKSLVLMVPMPALPNPPGVVLPAAALACTLMLRGSPSVVPKLLLEWPYFQIQLPDCSFFPHPGSLSLPTSCLMCFSLFGQLPSFRWEVPTCSTAWGVVSVL